MTNQWPTVRLGEVLRRVKDEVVVEDHVQYSRLTIRMNGKGIVQRDRVLGHEIGTKRQFIARTGQLVLSKIDARNGAFGILPPECDNAIITGNFWAFDVDRDSLLGPYFDLLTKTSMFIEFCVRASEGTTNRLYLQEDAFLAQEVRLPPLDEQRRIVSRIEELAVQVDETIRLRRQATDGSDALLHSALRAERERLQATAYPRDCLGKVTKVTAGGTPSRNNPAFWDGDIPWVKTGELKDGDISEAEELITRAGVDGSSAKVFPVGTILIALYGQGQTRGRTGQLLIPAATNQACCAVLPNLKVFLPRYVQYWLRSLYIELRRESQGGAQPNWNGETIKTIEVVFPPIAEQADVVSHLDALQAAIGTLKNLQTETASMMEALLPSILDRAFLEGSKALD